VNTGSYHDFIQAIIGMAARRESRYVCVANVHMLVEAYQNKDFASIVQNADVATPDGKPLSWALRLLYNTKQERVSGMDLLPDLLRAAEQHALPVYIYGGQQQTISDTQGFLQKAFPSLPVAGAYSPPFRKLTDEEENAVAERINQSGARLVFVVLGCPKQEKWMAAMKGKVHATMVGIGGALPVLIGAQKRAPVWMQKGGLEWLYRLLQEPSRLLKRYTVTNSMFLYLITKAYLKRKRRKALPGVSAMN
ncbi:MAG TPA: WecB/TagA/CpsF family glycosyltransferase, partial [Flavisolibacter sp.]|nr:WecB/TagA/CpsF family glycosyltransferase [Flavisolibacter sp.]